MTEGYNIKKYIYKKEQKKQMYEKKKTRIAKKTSLRHFACQKGRVKKTVRIKRINAFFLFLYFFACLI